MAKCQDCIFCPIKTPTIGGPSGPVGSPQKCHPDSVKRYWSKLGLTEEHNCQLFPNGNDNKIDGPPDPGKKKEGD